VIEVDGKPQYRHTVSNFGEVLKKFEGKNYPLALGGHIHGREELILGDPKIPTRFHQTSAVIGPGGVPGLNLVSGVTLYRVKDRVIEGHEFIAIDNPN
jgi:hypothetical protein